MTPLKLPNLVIIGVHKSATTSLFMYLKMHPGVFGASRKEIHYFTPLRYGRSLPPIEEYAAYFEDYANEQYAMEASPSYLYGKEVIINAMKAALGAHKIIIMLREPTARFISFYKHLKSKLLISETETMAAFIEKSVEYIGKPFEENNPYSRAVQEGFYIHYIQPWIAAYGNDLKIVYFEDLKHPLSLMTDIANWLQIDAGIYNNMEFTVENKTVFAKNKWLHKTALWVNETMESVLRNNPTIKKKIRDVYYGFNASGKEESADAMQIARLKNVYNEPNAKLKELFVNKKIKTASWM